MSKPMVFDEIKSQRMDELLVYFKLPTVNAQLISPPRGGASVSAGYRRPGSTAPLP
ncbi:MAG TPA: hypothetical protein VF331_28220 [Polyangiales bacterium]